MGKMRLLFMAFFIIIYYKWRILFVLLVEYKIWSEKMWQIILGSLGFLLYFMYDITTKTVPTAKNF